MNQQEVFDDEEMVEESCEIQEEDNPEASIICDTCGYENGIYSSTCLVCEKSLYDYEEEIQNNVPCYICGFLSPVGEYEDHTVKCEFEMKIMALKGKKVLEFTAIEKKRTQKKNIKKEDTKKCMYCGSSYLLEFIHEHEIKCPSKPKVQKAFQPKPEIEAIEFDLGNVLKDFEIERLTETQIKAVSYMHKKARYYDFLAKQSFENRIKKLGFGKIDFQILKNYMKTVPFVIHVSLERYLQFFLNDTSYRNLFETNTGSGSTSKLWRKEKEDKMFNNIFFDAEHHERVKYGAINIISHPEGIASAKAYGRSYFVLKNHVKPRCTITHRNSCTSSKDKEFGTFDHFSQVFENFSDKELEKIFAASKGDKVSWEGFGSYKQIQIIGPVEFSRDIAELCIDIQEIKDAETTEKIFSFIKMFGVPYTLFGN